MMFLLSEKWLVQGLDNVAAIKFSGYLGSKGISEYGEQERVESDAVVTIG